MKTKFKKGDKVIPKDKLTSDPLTVVNVTTKKEIKHFYYGLMSLTSEKKEIEVTRYELSNHKIFEEDELIEYSEGVQRLAKKVEKTFSDLEKVLKRYNRKSSCDDEDEDDED